MRLSIVIPVLRSFELLEDTLLSVLENRPDRCEVVVVSAESYSDPYDLAGEVRFIEQPAASSIVDLINAGIEASAAGALHVLVCGAEVTEGWSDAPLRHLAEARIAAVAPLVLDHRQRPNIVAAGLKYLAGGQRCASLEGLPAESAGAMPAQVLGPSIVAGFYRRDALELLGEAFSPMLGDHLADVDLALRLRRAGFEAVLEPSSIVYRCQAIIDRPRPFNAARLAERLFWRNAPSLGWARSLAAHSMALAADFVHPLRLLGRGVALTELGQHAEHHRHLESLAAAADSLEAAGATCGRVRPAESRQHPLRRAA